jgi:hypothetical protein
MIEAHPTQQNTWKENKNVRLCKRSPHPRACTFSFNWWKWQKPHLWSSWGKCTINKFELTLSPKFMPCFWTILCNLDTFRAAHVVVSGVFLSLLNTIEMHDGKGRYHRFRLAFGLIFLQQTEFEAFETTLCASNWPSSQMEASLLPTIGNHAEEHCWDNFAPPQKHFVSNRAANLAWRVCRHNSSQERQYELKKT